MILLDSSVDIVLSDHYIQVNFVEVHLAILRRIVDRNNFSKLGFRPSLTCRALPIVVLLLLDVARCDLLLRLLQCSGIAISVDGVSRIVYLVQHREKVSV